MVLVAKLIVCVKCKSHRKEKIKISNTYLQDFNMVKIEPRPQTISYNEKLEFDSLVRMLLCGRT